jgi:uncharacterized protein with PQ loop repeat
MLPTNNTVDAALSMLSAEFVTWVFVVANTGRLLAYLPQFISAWRCPHGAMSVSIVTWCYFSFAHVTALLYAALVLQDSKSVYIFAGNFFITACLVALLLYKRFEHRRAQPKATRAHVDFRALISAATK